jgi:hypothetical protein
MVNGALEGVVDELVGPQRYCANRPVRPRDTATVRMKERERKNFSATGHEGGEE